jgi:hypothetical protein
MATHAVSHADTAAVSRDMSHPFRASPYHKLSPEKERQHGHVSRRTWPTAEGHYVAFEITTDERATERL